jgi:ABC-type glycerol-3-phosphate transport system permease component
MGSLARHTVLLAFTATALFPIYFMISSALKTTPEFAANQLGPPHHPVLSTLHAVASEGEIFHWLLNSLIFTSASVAISTVLAALCAYPLSLMRWRPARWLLMLMIALIVIPPIVLVVPLFQMVVELNELSTYRSVIVIYAGIMVPFSWTPRASMAPPPGASFARSCCRSGYRRSSRSWSCRPCGSGTRS